MVAALIAAAIVSVMSIVVVQETGFPADWAGWIRSLIRSWRPTSLPRSLPRYARAFGGKLVIAHPAKILLIAIGIFAVTIKVIIIVAFRAVKLVYFCHENSSPFWEVLCFVTKALYH